MNDKNQLRFLCVSKETPLKEVLYRHAGATDRNLPAGIALVVDDFGILIGSITDGDVRRSLIRSENFDLRAEEVMNRNPIVFPENISFQEIIERLPDELKKRGRRSRKYLGKIILVDAVGKPANVLDYHQLWEQRVATHRHVVVLGMGYVGLTLALALSREGFQVTGVDIDSPKIEALKAGRSHVHEAGLEELLTNQLNKGFSLSTTIPKHSDVFIIAVGSPVRFNSETNRIEPDISGVIQISEEIGEKLRSGNLVILRSTVPVGTTRKYVLPVLEKASGLRGGVQFHLSFAPERTVEGQALKELSTLPQVIGGLNGDSVEATVALFRELTPMIVRVDPLESAELAKLINNGFRDLIFAFSNQIATQAKRFNLDIVACIQAANEGYPRDRIPLPSPGVGGPCLVKDPYILASMAHEDAGQTSLSEIGRSINESMHQFVAGSILEQLKAVGKRPADCSMLLCGLAFKGRPETSDIRASVSVEIARILQSQVGVLHVHDAVVSEEESEQINLQMVKLPDGFQEKDAIVFLNNHPMYERIDVFEMVRSLNHAGIIYDAWGLFRPEDILNAGPCIYMGLSSIRSSIPPEQMNYPS